MQGRFHDGLDAGSHAAQAAFDGRVLTIEANGQTHQWPIADLAVDIHGGEARVSRRRSDARLIVSEADWRAASSLNPGVLEHSAAGGRGLIIGLVGALYTGIGWMSNLREALSEQWGQPPTAPAIVKKTLFDPVLTLLIYVDQRYLRCIMKEVFPPPYLLQEMDVAAP